MVSAAIGALVKGGVKKLVRYGVGKVAKKARGMVGKALGFEKGKKGVKFSKEAAAKGAVNMVKRGMVGSKGTHAGAYLPKSMRAAKEMASGGMGGTHYVKRKLLPTPNALSYERSAGATKTRK